MVFSDKKVNQVYLDKRVIPVLKVHEVLQEAVMVVLDPQVLKVPEAIEVYPVPKV